jgi:zinc transport system substrate-binding protein
MTRLLLAGFFLLSTLWAGSVFATPPKVVVSILPIHSLVAGVMEGIAKPQLLIRGGASPHSTSLRPSDARILAEAELIFWVSEDLETFLIKPLKGLAKKATIIELMETPGVTPAMSKSEDEVQGKDNHEKHDKHDSHHHGDGDPHIWLSTANAKAIVRAATKTLAKLDPKNASRYEANAQKLEMRLTVLHKNLAQNLKPIQKTPYIVFHDAYGAFENEFSLKMVGAVTISPDRKPGIRKLKHLRHEIAEHKTPCVFAEPQFSPSLIKTLISGSQAKMGVLDPIGANLHPGPNAYFELMHEIANALTNCLANSATR